MTVVHIESIDQLHEIVKGSGDKVVVIDYFADWCGPCVGFSPTFEAMAREMTNVAFLKVNVDECGEAAEEARIESIPAFHVYKNGSRKEIVVGASESKLRDAIKSVQSK